MQITTIQGIVKNGQIQLSEDVKLLEMTEVYVVVPKMESQRAKIMSSRLFNKSDAEKFVKKIEDEDI